MINQELQKRLLSSIIIIPVSLFFIINSSIYFISFMIFFVLVASYEWVKMNKFFFIKIVGILYLLLASYLIYLLRNSFSLEIFLMILLICIFTDMGGYMFGKLFKGPKLTKISPKKTYSGVFGSFILSLIAALIFKKYFSINDLPTFSSTTSMMKIMELEKISISLILFISLLSQIGDLIISYFKRLANIKDTGNILPGHGGLLDRVDGIIFAMPISYLLLIY
jgi:phosphatidate cytidylyltransferase